MGSATRHAHVLTEYEMLAGSQCCHSHLCFLEQTADCESTLESVHGKYESLSTELPTCSPLQNFLMLSTKSHVSFAFDTIGPGSLIVCGLTTRPCILQALWPPCSNYNENVFLPWFRPGLCPKPKRVFASWNMVVMFRKSWLYSSDTLVHLKNLLLDHDCSAEYWTNMFNIAMILEEDGSRCVLVFFFYVGDAGNTSSVDVGTPLGATAVVTPGSAGYLLWECCILASL